MKAQQLCVITVFAFIALPPIPSLASVSFQQGVGGYFGTTDTHLRGGYPTTPSYEDRTWVDYPNVPATTPLQGGFHGLLRLEIIGNGAGQIPLGTGIISATLTLTTADINGAGKGDGGQFHRMLLPWNESSTWSSFTDGIQADGVEATAAPSASAGYAALRRPTPWLLPGPISFDVTDDVSAWAAGAPNYGWAILPWLNGVNGWGFWSSEYSNISERPKLVVEVIPEPAPFSLIGLVTGGIYFTRRFFVA